MVQNCEPSKPILNHFEPILKHFKHLNQMIQMSLVGNYNIVESVIFDQNQGQMLRFAVYEVKFVKQEIKHMKKPPSNFFTIEMISNNGNVGCHCDSEIQAKEMLSVIKRLISNGIKRSEIISYFYRTIDRITV